MKISFDVTQFLLQYGFETPTGISRVEFSYVKYLLQQDHHEVDFVTSYPPLLSVIDREKIVDYVRATERCWGIGTDAEVERDKRSVSTRRRAAASSLWNATLNAASGRRRPNCSDKNGGIYLSVSGWRLPTPWVESWLLSKPHTRSIFLLHDIIPISHPEYVREKSRRKYKSYLRRVLNCASLIIANSKDTEHALRGYCAKSTTPVPPIEVIPLGVDPAHIGSKKHQGHTPDFFLVLGTVEPRKNHLFLLKVWKRMIQCAGKSNVPKLYIVGKLGWRGEEILSELEKNPLLAQHIVHIKDAGDHRVQQLIQDATAVLFPSLVEGYGLPLVEALDQKARVLCSDLPVFRDLGGDFPEYLPVDNVEKWAEAINTLATQTSSQLEVYQKKILSFQPPRWKQHFEQLEKKIVIM